MLDITKQYQTMEGETVVLISDKGPAKLRGVAYPLVGYIVGCHELHCWNTSGVNPYNFHKNLVLPKAQIYLLIYKNGMAAPFTDEAAALCAAKAHPEATAIKFEYTPGQRDF